MSIIKDKKQTNDILVLDKMLPLTMSLVKIDNNITSFEYKRVDGFYFVFDGKLLKNDKPYSRTFHKTNKSNELKRSITPSFPNIDKPDKTQEVRFTIDNMRFTLTELKFGNKSVCYLKVNDKINCTCVSKQVIISIVADRTTKSWNYCDQYIKSQLGLKTTTSKKSNMLAQEV